MDSSGNAASASTSYSVRYAFAGFYSPLVAEPASAGARAGDTVPVKFSLDGDRGLDVLTLERLRSPWLVGTRLSHERRTLPIRTGISCSGGWGKARCL